MPRVRSWTDQQLRNAVKTAVSFRAVIHALGLVPAGGNYAQVRSTIKRLALDTSHFAGQGWNKDKTYSHTSTLPVDTYLVEHSYIQSFKLKKNYIMLD